MGAPVTALLPLAWPGYGAGAVAVTTLAGVSVWDPVLGSSVTLAGPGVLAGVSGDVTGDGVADVVCVSADGGSVVVFPYPAGTPPLTIAGCVPVCVDVSVVDIDGNGLVDVVLAQGGSGGVFWLQNFGHSTFVPVAVSVPLPGVSAVTAGPVGSGTHTHIVAVWPGGVTVLWNGGGGAAFTPTLLPASTGAVSATVADVDQDGRGDVLCVTASGDVVWYQALGAPASFVRRVEVIAAAGVTDIAAVDVARTGALDLLVTRRDCGNGAGYLWYANALTPSLSIHVPAVVVSPSASTLPVGVVVSEATGITTLACVGACAQVDGSDVSASLALTAQGVYSFVYGATSSGGSSLAEWAWHPLPITVSLVTSSGVTLSASSAVVPGMPWRHADTGLASAAFVAFGAFAAAGGLGAVTIASDGAVAVVPVVTVASPGPQRRLSSPPTPLPGNGTAAAVLDANADGVSDIVVFVTGTSGVCVWLGEVSGGWAPLPCQALSDDVTAATPLDVNNDGYVDMLTLSPSAGVGLLWGDGTGAFTPAPLLFPALGYCSVSVCDVDGDGHPDILAYGCTTPAVLLLLRRGSASVPVFIDASARLSGGGALTLPGAVSAVCVDVTGDGAVDIFIAGPSRNYLYVNNGSGWLVEQAVVRGVLSPGSYVSRLGATVDAADVDLDGDVDVYVCLPSGASSLFVNGGSGGFVDRAADWNLTTCAGIAAFAAVGVVARPPDVAAAGWMNPRGVPGMTAGVLAVTVLSRTGAANQHGAAVNVACGSDPLSMRVIGGVSPSSSRGLYPVTFGVSNASAPCALSVAFPSGVAMSWATVSTLAAVVPASLPSSLLTITLLPFATAVTLSPSTGTLGIGGVLVLRVVAGGGETGLVPLPAACSVAGLPAAPYFAEVGAGVYTFTLPVVEGVVAFGPGQLAFSLQLQDGEGHASPVFTQALLPPHSLAANGFRPGVHPVCVFCCIRV